MSSLLELPEFKRIKDAGVGDRVEVLKADYRELDGVGKFDKIVYLFGSEQSRLESRVDSFINVT